MSRSVSPPYPENVGLAKNGGLPIDVFLGLWFLVLRYECVRTVYSVLQLGYWKDYASLVRWVKYRNTGGVRGSDEKDRQVVHCCFVGKDRTGKVRVAGCDGV